MKIILGAGVDNARFGMTADEAGSVLGAADKDYIEDDGDRCLCYNLLGLVLKFEEEHAGRLGWILVINPEAMLWDIKPIGRQFSDFEQIADSRLQEAKDHDDHGYWGSTMWEDSWIEVQHTLGRIDQINFGVRFDTEDKPQWPKPEDT